MLKIIFIIILVSFILLIIVYKFKQKEKTIQVYTVQDFIQISNDGSLAKEGNTVVEKVNDL